MRKIGKQEKYIKFFKCAMRDPDIAEKFQCVAKIIVADFLQRSNYSRKKRYEALVLFREIIKTKGARYIDRKFARKSYKKLSKELRRIR